MKKIAIAAIVLISMGLIGCFLFLRSGLPDYTSQITAPGLKAPVLVERNRFAVPTITAQSMEDLFFAWGFVNAQDRMFQMEFTRRVGQGRISEFAGEEGLDKDIFLRGVGFEERAKQYAQRIDSENRIHYQRYVDGINYYLKENGPHLYMRLLGMKPEPWEISDSIVVGMMLNWTLSYNMKHEILYHRIIQKIGMDKGQRLLNHIPEKTPTIINDMLTSTLDDQALGLLVKRFDWLMGSRSASNGWVVGPEMTAHGGALFASDMQVHQSKLPSDFYLVRVRSGDFDVTGAQVVGLPFVASGYNRNCAWGLTNQGADMVDLFMETIDWDKKTFHFQGQDIPLTRKTFTFTVKGKKKVEKSIYYVGRRPVLSEVFKDLGFDVSLDWAGFDSIDFQGFFLMNQAKNYDEFMDGARLVRISPQNLTYADDRGNIAFRVVGSMPLREKDTGNFIADGRDKAGNWNGNIPDDQYPMLKNPSRGFIISSNNKNVTDYPFYLNGTYSPAYRYENIAGMLRGKKNLDVEYFKKVQTDTRTVLSRIITDLVAQQVVLAEEDQHYKMARDLLLSWDGDNTTDSAGASIYNTFFVRFAYNTFVDELGEDLAAEYVSERYISMERFFQMIENQDEFFDDVRTDQKETVSDIALKAFKEACDMLANQFGTADPVTWHWGKIHHIRFDHVLGKSAVLRPLVNYGPFPFEGDSETNNRARFSEVEPPFTADLASAPRIIVRFDPEPRGFMMLITGQNEHFMSRHSTDMTDAWRRHEYFSVDDEYAAYRMMLMPEAVK
jgi:penicillin G amidase